MKFERLALIGCGLMGGSFALALRQSGQVRQLEMREMFKVKLMPANHERREVRRRIGDF